MNADGIMGLLFETMAAQGKELAVPEPDTEEADMKRWIVGHGSGFEGGKVRILAALKLWAENDPKRFEAFLRDEYGVGGCSMPERWFMDYNGSGIIMRHFDGEEYREYRFSWAKVARMYVEDYRGGFSFADMKTMQRMWDIQRTVGIPEPAARLQYPQGVLK